MKGKSKSQDAALGFHVDREVVIRAERSTVWRFFQENELFARWWGSGSTIDLRPGGSVCIKYPQGMMAASGTIREFQPAARIVFTYGYEPASSPDAPGAAIPRLIAPGASLVTIDLTDHPDGTLVRLRHEVDSASVRDHHVDGWRYHMARFADAATSVQHEGNAAIADTWVRAWGTRDREERQRLLAACCAPNVRFLGPHGVTAGLDDLDGLIASALVHMASFTLRRAGVPRQSHGIVLYDWEVAGPDGSVALRGTNVNRLTPGGLLSEVIGVAAAG